LSRLLESEFELVGTVEDGGALLAEARRLRPDVILLDVSMPRLNGIDAARRLRSLLPGSRLVFVTMHDDPTYVAEAFQAGASGYVVKRSAASTLIRAIRTVLGGWRYGAPTGPAGRAPKVRPVGDSAGSLTTRQREILQLVAEGRAAREIAGLLGVSVKTVEFHKARIAERLGRHGTAELTRYAIAHGLVAP
jgi:DNA-binding NarL/FixJ family response regulator